MRVALLALASALIVVGEARAGEPLKPYVVLVLDTSGSMDTATGNGSPSCGGADTRLNHARCAINKIVNSYGDMVFALARFRMNMSGTTTAATFPSGCSTSQIGCEATGGDNFELLTPLVDGNNQLAGSWVNLTGNTCTATGTDPEIWTPEGNTPIGNSLLGTKLYWLGQETTGNTAPASNLTVWPANQAGFAPIANDPTRTAFLSQPGKPATCNPNPATCDASPTCTNATNCCCLQQCRPYITIMLTDGVATCGDANAAATSLLTTDVSNRRYRVTTKPIGFGITPGDANIENLAHAGGAADVAAVNEGFYASNENELQLAISSILDDAIRTEACNGLDDDCDQAIDEDFPGKNGACDNGRLGVCRTTGTLVCKADGTGLQCNAANGPAAGTESCNNLDDDCDGKVDENLVGCTCSPQAEQCNNRDEDCDTRIDEGITRPCGTGTCQGVETCAAGVFGGCTAQTPVAETCNGLDDNCDGVRDGFTQSCSTMTNGFPANDPRNNPGDPSRNPIPENICHPGLRTCPANVGPPNAFGQCLNEVKPKTEVCNGLDDDCDNEIDEDTGGNDCSTTCGVGTTRCVAGQIQCDSTQAANDPTCDNNDDDCDGRIDEDWVCANPPDCDCTEPGQCNAVETCEGGNVVCAGTPQDVEICDCIDNDCDGDTDEDVTCGAGSQCSAEFCQCAFECSNDEFPCPLGRFCREGLCLADPCFNVTCPPVNGNAQTCQVDANGIDHTCVDTCSVTNCAPLICIPSTGQCAADDCTTFPERCTAQESCIVNNQNVGVCVPNGCVDVTCGAGQYCLAGACVDSCTDIECPSGQRCRMGACEDDPCGDACPFGQACNDTTGQCVTNSCLNRQCPQGQWCNPNVDGGRCETDPCAVDQITCPNPTDVCVGGTCVDAQSLLPDAGVEILVTTGGGGGCAAGGGGGLGLLGLVGLALLGVARRRKS